MPVKVGNVSENQNFKLVRHPVNKTKNLWLPEKDSIWC